MMPDELYKSWHATYRDGDIILGDSNGITDISYANFESWFEILKWWRCYLEILGGGSRGDLHAER